MGSARESMDMLVYHTGFYMAASFLAQYGML